MRHLLRFPKLIARSRFQGRSTIPPPTHRFPLPPSHLSRTFSPPPKLCPYSNCDINQIGTIFHQRMEKVLNQKVEAGMKRMDQKFLDFSQRVKSAEKSTGEIIKDLTLDKARSILFDYLLANWYKIVVSLASLLGLADLVKEHLATFEVLRKEVYIFINETVKRLNEFDGMMREIITILKDFQARVEKLEKELKNSTSGNASTTAGGGATTPGA